MQETINIDLLISEIRALLPVQAPLPSFIHNNILQPFEKFQFDEGLRQAQDVYHSKAYMNETFYLKAVEEGKIADEDLFQSLLEHFTEEHLNSPSCIKGLTFRKFYKIILKEPPEFVPQSNLDWRLSHDILFDQTRPSTNFIPKIAQSTRRGLEHLTRKELLSLFHSLLEPKELDHFSRNLIESLIKKIETGRSLPILSDKFCLNLLWAGAVCSSTKNNKALTSPQNKFITVRWKRYFQKFFNDNIDEYTYPIIVHFLSNYLDQGMSYWPAPTTELGLWKHFCGYFLGDFKIFPKWAEYARISIQEYERNGLNPAEIISSELQKIDLPIKAREDYLKELALDLRGWTGLINKMELEPHLAPVKAPVCKLEDYLAIRLIIERATVQYLCEKHHVPNKLKINQSETSIMTPLESAYTLFQIFLTSGLNVLDLVLLNRVDFFKLHQELEHFDKDKRKMILHHAYEKHFYRYALDRITSNKIQKQDNPQRQVFFCIDDREESMRRHFEEIDPKAQTFGVVGFYGVDMNFVSALHPRRTPHCPVVLTPRKIIKEIPKASQIQNFNRIKRQHHFISRSLLFHYYSSRTMARGFFNSIIIGGLSPIFLFLKTFIPQPIDTFKKFSKKTFNIQFATDLTLIANDAEPGIGYNLEEMTGIASTLLKSGGLKTNFAPLVTFLGHGSNSINNPHLNAYGCGACGGRPGAPNARALAQICNLSEVRSNLKLDGFEIPDDTYFLGGFHDTCNDEIEFFDTELIPENLKHNFLELKSNLLSASKLNAQERSRYFKNANPSLTLDEAYSHVHARALDLSEPRAEYGHLKVAMCVIGRRAITKNLNLERRSFLVSYDPSIDPTGEILKGVLLNSIPVTAGISLDYFFSFVDSEKFGCGSKLPLNLISMMGVVSGSSGDIRLGLPRQSIDQHEPIRLLVVVETKEDVILNIINNHPRLKALVYNHWIRLVIISPDDQSLKMFNQDKFEFYQGIIK